jgi:hypothetical protein
MIAIAIANFVTLRRRERKHAEPLYGLVCQEKKSPRESS